MQRVPFTDTAQPNNGGDGRVDFYLVHLGPKGNNGEAWPYPNYCGGMSGYVLINTGRPGLDLPGVLAHEFFHLLQYTYTPTYGCVTGNGEYAWMRESTANWAVDEVYGKTRQFEQQYAPKFLDSSGLPLEDPGAPEADGKPRRSYGAYLWSFFLTDYLVDSSPIRLAWEATQGAKSLDAFQEGIKAWGGFTDLWPEFTLRNWNDAPVTDYQSWDNLAARIPEVDEVHLDGSLNGAPDGTVPLPGVDSIKHLSAKYYHIILDDPNVHEVTFYNGIYWKLSSKLVVDPGPVSDTSFRTLVYNLAQGATQNGVGIRAILKINGTWRDPRNWTYGATQPFCRDRPEEHVEEMVLIISNSNWQDTSYTLKPEDLPPTLYYSNIPCDGWKAVVHSTNAPWHDGPAGYTIDATYTMTNGSAVVFSDRDGDDYLGGIMFSYLPGNGSVKMVTHFTDQGGCTYDGEVTRDPADHSGHVSLFINNFALSGSGYRRYRLEGVNNGYEVISCPGRKSDTNEPWLWFAAAYWADADPSYKLWYGFSDTLRVSPDGKTIEADLANADVANHWTFTPVGSP